MPIRVEYQPNAVPVGNLAFQAGAGEYQRYVEEQQRAQAQQVQSERLRIAALQAAQQEQFNQFDQQAARDQYIQTAKDAQDEADRVNRAEIAKDNQAALLDRYNQQEQARNDRLSQMEAGRNSRLDTRLEATGPEAKYNAQEQARIDRLDHELSSAQDQFDSGEINQDEFDAFKHQNDLKRAGVPKSVRTTPFNAQTDIHEDKATGTRFIIGPDGNPHFLPQPHAEKGAKDTTEQDLKEAIAYIGQKYTNLTPEKRPSLDQQNAEVMDYMARKKALRAQLGPAQGGAQGAPQTSWVPSENGPEQPNTPPPEAQPQPQANAPAQQRQQAPPAKPAEIPLALASTLRAWASTLSAKGVPRDAARQMYALVIQLVAQGMQPDQAIQRAEAMLK